MNTFYFTLILMLGLGTGCAHRPAPPLQTVNTIDLQQYSGTWYEIARFEHFFEKGCRGATANYTQADDHIKVLNSCYVDGMMTKQAEGKAYVVENSGNSKLEVTFFWPFFGDYWVIHLADDYRYSVIGEPSRKYFWILSRDSTLAEADKQSILEKMPGWGYDPAKLYWTDPDAYTREP
jgi:apolipoprotein D and lipocalin family protein